MLYVNKLPPFMSISYYVFSQGAHFRGFRGLDPRHKNCALKLFEKSGKGLFSHTLHT